MSDDGHFDYTSEASDDESVDPAARLCLILVEAHQGSSFGDTHYDNDALDRRQKENEEIFQIVRDWISEHSSSELEKALTYRHEAGMTALHHLCRCEHAPPDLIEQFLETDSQLASWTDAFGWLPIHYACTSGDRSDVVQLLIEAYPESKVQQDRRQRTPLHFYVTRRDCSIDVARALSDTGAAMLADENGMLPMHYATAYGVGADILQLLIVANPDSLTVKDVRGRSPLHFLMANGDRSQSPEMLLCLLKECRRKGEDFHVDSDQSPTPLLTLAEYVSTMTSEQKNEKRPILSKVLGLYLNALSRDEIYSSKTSSTLRSFPRWLQDTVRRHLADRRRFLKNLDAAEALGDGAAKENTKYWLGDAHWFGKGTLPDQEEAVRWFQACSDGGKGCARLAYCYHLGAGLGKDEKQAQTLWEKSIPLLEAEAEKGDAESQRWLAECNYNGWGHEQNFQEAVYWLKLVVENKKGHANAHWRLGECYFDGKGVGRDRVQAMELMAKAVGEETDEDERDEKENKLAALVQSLRDDPSAENLRALSHCCKNGFGVEKSSSRAKEFEMRAAEMKDETASSDSKDDKKPSKQKKKGRFFTRLVGSRNRGDSDTARTDISITSASSSISSGPPLTASVIQQHCQQESVLFGMFEASKRNDDNVDAEAVFEMLCASPKMLERVLTDAGIKEQDKKELELIQSNPSYWAFYLSMLDRLRSHIRAGEAIASGSIATTSGTRNDIVKLIMAKNATDRLKCVAQGVCKLENIAKTVESVSQNVPLPGASAAGSLVAALLRIAGENEFMPFVRISYFGALSQIHYAHNGGMEGVIESTCRYVLWACCNKPKEKDAASKTHENAKLSWWKRKAYKAAGVKVSTQAQEDGFAAAECAVACLMCPTKGSKLHGIIDEDESRGNYSLPEILAASILELSVDDALPLFQVPDASSNNEVEMDSTTVDEMSELSLSSAGGGGSGGDGNGVSRAEHEALRKQFEAKLARQESEMRRLKRQIGEKQAAEEGQQAMAFVNPTDRLNAQESKVNALDLETARNSSQLQQDTMRIALLEDRLRQLEKVVEQQE